MLINEAVEQIVGKDLYMRRANKDGWKWIRIKPTDGPDYCVVHSPNYPVHQSSCRMWGPSAEDLMADDWEVVGYLDD